MKTNLTQKLLALLLLAAPASIAFGQDFRNDADRTRVIIDDEGNEVTQRARRVRVEGHFDQFGFWVPAQFKMVWEVIDVQKPNRDDFIYSKPRWVLDNENKQPRMGYSFTANPDVGANEMNAIASLLSQQSGRQLNVVKVHYLGYMVVQNPTRQMVVETRDANNGMTNYFDIAFKKVGRWNWSLENAEALPMVSANPPFIDNRSTFEANDPGKSVSKSQQRLQISLRNMRANPVDLFWVDFDGNEQSYGTLEPQQSINQETGDGHLWRFKENGRTIGFFLADANGPRALPISYGYRYNKPAWVVSEEKIQQLPDNQKPLGHYADFFANPQLDSQLENYFADKLSKKAGKQLSVVRAHYQLNRKPAPNVYYAFQLPQSFVIETRDADTDRARFWDAELSFRSGQRSLTNANELLIVASLGQDRERNYDDQNDNKWDNNKNRRLRYQRPDWVVSKQGYGGVVLGDENSPRMRWKAEKALQMIRDNGFNADLNRVLHAGTQTFYNSSKTYLVLEIDNGGYGRYSKDVWEVVLSESNGSSQATWRSLKQ